MHAEGPQPRSPLSTHNEDCAPHHLDNGLRRTNPRMAHKIIYDKAQMQPLEAVKLPSGLVSYNTNDIEQATTDFFKKAWSTPSGAATGTPPPWQQKSSRMTNLSVEESTAFAPDQTPGTHSLAQCAQRKDVFRQSIDPLG